MSVKRRFFFWPKEFYIGSNKTGLNRIFFLFKQSQNIKMFKRHNSFARLAQPDTKLQLRQCTIHTHTHNTQNYRPSSLENEEAKF